MVAGTTSEHNVLVNLRNKIFGQKELEKEKKDLQNLSQVTKGAQQQTEQLTQSTKEDSKAKDNNARSSRRQLIGNLGTMFAGMALARALGNLTATAREWVGVGEIMAVTMGDLMLPATLALMDNAILPLSEALTGLPEPAKLAIGAFTFGLQGLGTLLQAGGQFFLAMGALKIFFPELIAKIGPAITKLGGFRGALLKLGGISLIGVGLKLGFDEITDETGGSLIRTLGTGIAIALGTTMVTGSITAGIVLAPIIITGLLLYKFSQKLALESEAFKTLSGAAPGGVTDLTGNLPFQQRGTRIITPNLPAGFEDFKIDFNQIGNIGGGGGTSFSIKLNQSNNISGVLSDQIEEQIRRNNEQMTQEIRRIVQQ